MATFAWRSPQLARTFRQQTLIGWQDVDVVCFEVRLIVEVDGGQHTDQQPYDTQRTAWLEAQGFRVLRFWNTEVLGNVGAVKEVIARACERESPSP
jgi:very-short-patch-repair endonuclease